MLHDLHPINRLAGIPYIRRWPGIPPEILVNYGDLIQEIIKVNKLTPVSRLEAIGGMTTRSTATASTLNDHIEWWWKYGGMKAAHLHYAGEVYALNSAQWEQFSSAIVKDFSKKLAGSKNISYNELVEVVDAVSGIG
jgi:hypothetical protein